jgi:Plasmid pRiA4b ORF-3-like protein
MSRQLYHLKVTLADVSPRVWRSVVVPGAYTLDRVHRVIQLAMGWQECHLHSFDVNGAQYGRPDDDGLLEMRDELDARLDSVVGPDGRFVYTYDFGDWWEHEVVVTDVLVAQPDERYPACTGGEGACPPEDVGGAYGYERFRAAIADPHHKDHEAMVEWYGERAVPHEFDADRATALMRRMA